MRKAINNVPALLVLEIARINDFVLLLLTAFQVNLLPVDFVRTHKKKM